MGPLAVERSRWLGELAQAIEEAQHLIWQICMSSGLSSETLDLCARLEVVRNELDLLRRDRGRGTTSAEWTSVLDCAAFGAR
jgi:hypothetical protein